MIFIFSFWLELAVIVICLAIGGRFSGIGLGVAGGFGLAILTLGFGLPVGEMPTSVVFIIMTVITCVSLLQGAGGLDYMISMAEKILRKKPSAITFLGPLVSYIFTVICGTSYVAFSVYPVIAEIAINAKVRPERAMSMSVIASNMAGPTSYIKDQENGFFFKPRDGKDLNQKIEDILSMNEHQIKEIKDHAYQTAKAYDVNDISQNLVDIFNGI